MTGASLRCSLSFIALALAAAPLHAGTTIKVKAGESIQAAITLAVEGDTVSVAKGVYNENVVMTTQGVTLKGASATINGGFHGNCITVTANNVVVTGMILVNGGGVADALVDGPPPPTGGILATGNGITLSKLTINSCEDFGISLTGDSGIVDGCKVDACLEDGITVTTLDETQATATEITKNTVSRCDTGIRAEVGPFSVQSNTCTFNAGDALEVNLTSSTSPTASDVSKNKCNNNGDTGLIVSTSGEMTTRVVVEKNTMDENGDGCILEGSDMDVTSNTITDSITVGLEVDATLVTLDKNKIQNSGGIGVLLVGFNNTLTKNTVQNSGSDGVFITGNTELLDGNTVKDGEGDGIQIAEGVLSCTLSKNTVSGNEHDGIDNSGTITIINGNNSKSNGGADIAGAGNGAGLCNNALSVDNKVGDDSDIVTFLTLSELDMPLP